MKRCDIVWPNDLEELVYEHGKVEMAKRIGVTATAVSYHLRKRGAAKYNRGKYDWPDDINAEIKKHGAKQVADMIGCSLPILRERVYYFGYYDIHWIYTRAWV